MHHPKVEYQLTLITSINASGLRGECSVGRRREAQRKVGAYTVVANISDLKVYMQKMAC